MLGQKIPAFDHIGGTIMIHNPIFKGFNPDPCICRKGDDYYIVTDRWQKFTEEIVTLELMEKLGSYCDEFLVHAVDVEGKAHGVETELAELLGQYTAHPVTYAGGVGSMADIEELRRAGQGRLDVTVGSALDIFGGSIPFEVLAEMK